MPLTDLDWQDARQEHLKDFNGFTCAEPAQAEWDRIRREKLHPQPWQLSVQSAVRSMSLPLPSDEMALLLYSAGTLAGVSRFGWTDGGEQLLVMTIARDVRFKGQGVGAELLRQTLEYLRAARDAADSGCGAFARIDHRNLQSKRAFEGAGFAYLEDDYEDPNLEYWMHDLL
nr:GNAT family N-acetyltransferase [Curtobacterium sp. VKM Ac-1395]